MIDTDASNAGIGAVVIQKDDDGQAHPIAYASRKMNPAETLYSTREQEALAIIFAIDKFDEFVRGRRFVVVTDHRSLSWLLKVPILKGRLLNWAYKLRAYDFEIAYRRGSENAMADMLSRLHLVQRAHMCRISKATEGVADIQIYSRVPERKIGTRQAKRIRERKRQENTPVVKVYPAHPQISQTDPREGEEKQPAVIKRKRGRPRKGEGAQKKDQHRDDKSCQGKKGRIT